MDHHPSQRKSSNMASLLQGDEIFFNKLLTRDPSKGFSSHIYQREANGIPFKWESQPGTPINPHSTGPVPPINLPPSANKSFKSLPCMDNVKKTSKLTIWFWKKTRRNQEKKITSRTADDGSGRIIEGFESCRFESSRDSTSSWCSSEKSCSFDESSCPSSTMSRSSHYWSVSRRIPWNFTSAMICVSSKK